MKIEFENIFLRNMNKLYTQTWSGNVRMIRCARNLGFETCNRNVGSREVGGQKYDGLTFARRNNDIKQQIAA